MCIFNKMIVPNMIISSRESLTLETEKPRIKFGLSLTSCVTSDKLPNLSKSRFLHLSKRRNYTFIEDTDRN